MTILHDSSSQEELCTSTSTCTSTYTPTSSNSVAAATTTTPPAAAAAATGYCCCYCCCYYCFIYICIYIQIRICICIIVIFFLFFQSAGTMITKIYPSIFILAHVLPNHAQSCRVLWKRHSTSLERPNTCLTSWVPALPTGYSSNHGKDFVAGSKFDGLAPKLQTGSLLWRRLPTCFANCRVRRRTTVGSSDSLVQLGSCDSLPVMTLST